MTDADRATTDLADFTTTTRIVPIAALAILIGVFAAYVAAALLKLIGLFTNLFFFQRLDTALVSPAGHHLGPFVILVPVAGALTIGVMARYGSDPLEIVFAREVMRAPEPSGAANPLQPGDVVAYPDEPLRVIVYRMAETGRTEVAVVSRTDRAVVGVIALSDLLTARTRILDAERRRERVLGAGLRLPTMFGGGPDSNA
jgi:CBS domain-containing protein